jgi:hypothetical protein
MDKIYYKKYKKYKKKYIRFGGAISSDITSQLKSNFEISKHLVSNTKLDASDSEIKSLLSFVKVNKISGNIISDLENFNNGCIRIANWLNDIYDKSGSNEPIPVICPGDSPAKIVRFLQLSNLIDSSKFDFISFSLSGMGDFYASYNIKDSSCYDDELCSYIYDKISDITNFENLVIMDYIARGCSVYSIIDAILGKMKPIPLNIRNTLDNIYIEVQSLVNYKGLNKLAKLNSNSIPNSIPKTRNVLNIENLLSGSIEYIMEAEKYNSRCLPSNNEYETNLQYTEEEQFNCNLFVYISLLYNRDSAKLIDIWKSNPSKYTVANIENYFNKILTVKIVNNSGEIENINDVVLSHIGYGGDNTVRLLVCPETFTNHTTRKSQNIDNILDIKVVRNISGFDESNYSAIYKIEYLDNDNIVKTDNVFYSYASHSSYYLHFIKLNYLTSAYPWYKYRDNVNNINIYPNRLLSAKLTDSLPTKTFSFINEYKYQLVEIQMIHDRKYQGFMSTNMNWGIYLAYGKNNENNEKMILINNLIKKITLIENLTPVYKESDLDKYLNKHCTVKFTNGTEYIINVIYESFFSYDNSLSFKPTASNSGFISININQILDIQLFSD